jgi:hypothetical protein
MSEIIHRKNITYQEVNRELKSIISQAESDFIVLKESLGPWPYWRLPKDEDIIPYHCSTLYAIERNKEALIVLVRTESGDQPLAIGDVNIITYPSFSNE